MRKIALIDSDSILYILGWHARELTEVGVMNKLVEEFMVNIIQKTGATHYLGVFSPSKTFRNRIATIKPYKGQRPPSPEWFKYWDPIIKEQCINEYGYFVADDIEADDVLSIMRNGSEPGDEVILVSPDKDLKQIPGNHYNYSKDIWDTVSPEQANYNLWRQIIVGDTSDNITGIKGVGPKGAEKLLAGDPITYQQVVEAAFEKVYGHEWCPVYQEIVSLVKLVQPWPDLVKQYSTKIQEVQFAEDKDEVDDLLNMQADGVLQGNKRSHEDDLLRPPFDISE